MKNFINFFISLCFTGYIKKIPPGTFATFVSILILFPIVYYKLLSFQILIIIFIFFVLISLYLINLYSKQSKTHDNSVIVIDEFLGVYLIFLFYNEIYILNNILTNILIFLVFRFFDIFKIYPANLIDKKMINSLGVLLDDLIAAFYTIITLYIINVFI